MSRWRALQGDQRGVAIVELALVFPLMLVLFCGCFEASEVLRADMKLRNAAQTLANLVAAQNSVDSNAIANFCSGAQLVMSPFPASALAGAVASVTDSQAGTPGVDWQDDSCGNAPVIASPASLAAPLVSGAGDSVIVVQTTYRYQSPLSFVLPATVTLSRTAFARPRNAPSVSKD